MREDLWTFQPTHKLVLCTNHKPTVRGTDHAIWRRLRLVPFTVTFSEEQQDKDLLEKLRAELPGILNWCLVGCQQWQQHGLADPPEVKAATAGYRTEQDRMGEFLSDRCCIGADYRIKKGELYGTYKTWCEAQGERQINATAFGMALAERGITSDSGRRWYIGIALTDPP